MNLAEQSIRMRLEPDRIAGLIADAAEVRKQAPLLRPLAGGRPMRVLVTSAGDFGWVGDGEYRYDPTQANGKPWPAMPQSWSDIADEVMGESFPWDSAIMNWYAEDASLGWHRDLAERDCSMPIVTIALGDSCSWAIRLDDDTDIHRCTVSNGDVTVLDGPTRLALHTVERIKPEPLLSPFGVKRGRLSITVRVAG